MTKPRTPKPAPEKALSTHVMLGTLELHPYPLTADVTPDGGYTQSLDHRWFPLALGVEPFSPSAWARARVRITVEVLGEVERG